MTILERLTAEFHLKPEQTENTVRLLDEGNTVPFIARYRKELTGSLSDQTLRELCERLEYLRKLEERKQAITEALTETGKLTDELADALQKAETLAQVEDIYRPFRPKRRTRGAMAREKGLEPLAALLLKQERGIDPEAAAEAFLTEAVPTVEDALSGAMDILAEDLADRADLRSRLRTLLWKYSKVAAQATDPEQETVYRDYYQFSEPLNRVADHRVLALNRGETAGALRVSITPEEPVAVAICRNLLVTGNTPSGHLVAKACEDSYRRLIFPSLERELRADLTGRASTSAIRLFSSNLRQLLLTPPLKGRVTLGLDPAYRTGCKIAVVDETGRVLETAVIYPTPPQSKTREAAQVLRRLILTHGVTVIAIGNGTASRESEAFVAELLPTLPVSVEYGIVSEAGASVYSASPLGAAEFPELDVTLRSAVSIARRLQDPLAELVKIEPRSIGVGQYQHDMPPAQLNEALAGVVEDCVNQVGVDLNTASAPLLCRVAGLNEATARSIVRYREENGAFQNRQTLLKVPRLGKKTFTQCAGFLRVSGGDCPLDNTGIHPEGYGAAEKLLAHTGFADAPLGRGLPTLRERAEEIGITQLSRELAVGEPTLQDMLEELTRPGRDPREELPPPKLRKDVLRLEELQVGMELTGTVRNLVDFGAFVDIGIHEAGLLHISQMSNRRIAHPTEVLKVGDVITVWVISVDVNRRRVGLSVHAPKQEGVGV